MYWNQKQQLQVHEVLVLDHKHCIEKKKRERNRRKKETEKITSCQKGK